jgi:hypothetical protein
MEYGRYFLRRVYAIPPTSSLIQIINITAIPLAELHFNLARRIAK